MHALSSIGRNDIEFSRRIPPTLRIEALNNIEFTCHMCGLGPGEIDSATGRRSRLRVGYLIDKSLGGKDNPSNLWAACSICIQGSKNITSEKPTARWLLLQIRRAGQEEQREVLKWLLKKFKN